MLMVTVGSLDSLRVSLTMPNKKYFFDFLLLQDSLQAITLKILVRNFDAKCIEFEADYL